MCRVVLSDASSEYLSTVEVTDSEDAARNGSIVSQEPTGPQLAVMGGSYTGLSPMIIMNNFVLKQVKYFNICLNRLLCISLLLECFIAILSLSCSAQWSIVWLSVLYSELLEKLVKSLILDGVY